METIYQHLTSLLQEWAEEYREYLGAVESFSGASRFVRWMKGMKEPKHPSFHVFPIIVGDDVLIELRCYDGLFIACADANHRGYKLDLQTGKKSPLLGARGMNVNPWLESKVNEWGEIIHELAYGPEHDI